MQLKTAFHKEKKDMNKGKKKKEHLMLSDFVRSFYPPKN